MGPEIEALCRPHLMLPDIGNVSMGVGCAARKIVDKTVWITLPKEIRFFSERWTKIPGMERLARS